MSLDLDKRQRAMLREMGVRVWQPPTTAPAPALAPAADAIELIAEKVQSKKANSTFHARPTLVAAPAPAAARADLGSAWRLGEGVVLYANAALATGPRWLVLAESTAAASASAPPNPFEGEAGKLLDNMLRAVRLHQAGSVLFAPLHRDAAASGPVAAGLADLWANPGANPGAADRPDVVLVMGRLAAQALLQSSEPFGKLRGQVHELQGIPTIVTHDAPYLLRNPLDKAKAWEDLCLALSVVA